MEKNSFLNRCIIGILAFILCFGITPISIAYGKAWVVLIGVSRYYDSSFPPLKGVNKDLEDMQHFILSKVKVAKEDLFILKDEGATKEAINSLFGSYLKNTVTQKDTIILYITGHAILGPDLNGDESDFADEYFVTYDSLKGRFDTLLSDDEIHNYLRSLDYGHLLIIIDTCFAGGLTKDIGVYQRKLYLRNAILLASSQEFEASLETNNKGGLFTYYFVKLGFKYKDKIPLKKLYKKISYILKRKYHAGSPLFLTTERGEVFLTKHGITIKN